MKLVKIDRIYFNPEQINAIEPQMGEEKTLIYTQGYSDLHEVDMKIDEVVKLLQENA